MTDARAAAAAVRAAEPACAARFKRKKGLLLVRLLLVQLLNMRLQLYVHLSLIVQFAPTKS
jgi:hypothetical protein